MEHLFFNGIKSFEGVKTIKFSFFFFFRMTRDGTTF